MKQKWNGDRIVIAENVSIKDMDGLTRNCTLEINTNIIADVYVHYNMYDTNKKGWHLCEDDTFIDNVMKYFKKMGYKGPSFGRAELGMQEKNCAVLEPNKEFEVFAQKKFNFKLSDNW